jgi:uncharacterized membrane protein HdeD (DUF308 family)
MSPSVSTNQGVVRVASTISLLAGLWLFVSPWIYGSYMAPDAWNYWIVGAVIAILAAFRLSSPAANTWMSWLNCLLGIWTFASPWIYGYTSNTGQFVNSLCVGVIVFIVAMRSATGTRHQAMVSSH